MSVETAKAAQRLLRVAAVGLDRRGGEGVDEVLARLAGQDVAVEAFRAVEPGSLPVLRYLPECTGEAMLVDADLAAAVAELDGALGWRQSAAYSDQVLGAGFMDNYGWCEIVGSHGFFPGDDFRLGLLLLGPERHYRDHYHPAPELYWNLTGPSDWKRGAGGFTTREAGATVWHDPYRMHATKTGARPLFTLWCWTRDTDTPARLAAQ